MLVLLAGLQLGRRNEEPAWFWVIILSPVALKIATEPFTGARVVVSGFSDVRTVPFAHIFGVVCAAVFLSVSRWNRIRGKRVEQHFHQNCSQ